MKTTIHAGDCREVLRQLPENSVHCCVTSPPYYGLRDYQHGQQIWMEKTPEAFVYQLVEVFREVRRVLRDDGTLWVNIGDSYASFKDAKCVPNSSGGGQRAMPTQEARNRMRSTFAGTDIKNKDLIGIPWMLAFALRRDGWFLRQDLIWSKPNPMPESVTDRCVKAHEYVFLLSKSERYFFDHLAIQEKAAGRASGNVSHKYAAAYESSETEEHRTKAGLLDAAKKEWEKRNKRSVWDVATRNFSEAHFAVYPPELIEPCILAGAPEGGVVLDPFFGAGTTAIVAGLNGRECIGVELNPDFIKIAEKRLYSVFGMFSDITLAGG